MLIVISPEITGKDEIAIVNTLFEKGLRHFHFRKPTANLQEHIEYLKQVDARYHNYIVTHNFQYELCEVFNLKGIHLEEAVWRDKGEELNRYVTAFAKAGKTTSASYHEPEDLIQESVSFDYTILSPVFAAISKSTMKGRAFDVTSIDKTVIGMGGINAQTVTKAMDLGYKGVGTLGGVWNMEDPIRAFCDLKEAYDSRS